MTVTMKVYQEVGVEVVEVDGVVVQAKEIEVIAAVEDVQGKQKAKVQYGDVIIVVEAIELATEMMIVIILAEDGPTHHLQNHIRRIRLTPLPATMKAPTKSLRKMKSPFQRTSEPFLYHNW